MYLLFDLDGTLFDSTDLLLSGYKHTVRTHLDRESADEEWLPHFGRPLRWQMALFSEEMADEMVSTYRRFYAENHDLLLRLYPGIPEMLEELRSGGCKMAVVTSKHTAFAVRGLELFQLDRYFEAVIGETEVATHKPDPASVLLAMERLGADPAETWMIGDSPFDIQAGHNAGVKTAACLWGPFPRTTLEPDAPTLFIERPQDLPLMLSTFQEDTAR
jgi:pyrophosphatase PpaX